MERARYDDGGLRVFDTDGWDSTLTEMTMAVHGVVSSFASFRYSPPRSRYVRTYALVARLIATRKSEQNLSSRQNLTNSN